MLVCILYFGSYYSSIFLIEYFLLTKFSLNQILENYFHVFYISKVIRYWPANLLSHLSFQYLKCREKPYLFNCRTAISNSNISLFSSELGGKKEIDLLNWFDGFISWNTHISIMFTINMSVFSQHMANFQQII